MSDEKKQSGSAVRAAALSLFLEVNEEGQFYNKVLHDTLEKHAEWEKQDRAFFTRLTTGVIERRIFLDDVIGRYSKTPLKKMRPIIRNLLRMGIYQILYLNQVPDHAACNETVKLATKRGMGSLRGFLNGVLRTICREKDTILTVNVCDTPNDCSIWYSMPLWIVELWWKEYGKDATIAMLKQSLLAAPLSIRVAKAYGGAEKLRDLFVTQGMECECGNYAERAIHLQRIDRITSLPGYEEGTFLVQDESSMLAGQCADVKPGMIVIDLCAAPGGKSLYAAECLDGSGTVISRDVSQGKVDQIAVNAKRMGLSCIQPQVWDATVTDETLQGMADVVIADLPCSGLGVMGRKPDIKYRVKPEDIASLQGLQRKILMASLGYLKPGGILVYSTCTVNRSENDENADWLMQTCGLKPESLNPYLPICLQSEQTAEGRLQLLPGVHECAGFYIARYRK